MNILCVGVVHTSEGVQHVKNGVSVASVRLASPYDGALYHP